MMGNILTKKQAIKMLKLADGYDNNKEEQVAQLTQNAPQIEQALNMAVSDPEVRKAAVEMVPYIRCFMTNTGQLSLDSLYHLSDACSAAGEKEGELSTNLHIGIIAHERGDDANATRYLTRGLTLAEESGNIERAGELHYRLGDIALHASKLDDAQAHFDQSLKNCQQTGNLRGEADATYGLAHVHRLSGKSEQAIAGFNAAAPLYEKAGFRMGQANCLFTIGEIYVTDGKPSEAKPYLERAQTIYHDIHYKLGIAHTLKWLTDVERLHGNTEGLHEKYQEAHAIYMSIQDMPGASTCLRAQGHLEAGRDPKKAMSYYQQALALVPDKPHYQALLYEDMAKVSRPYYLEQAVEAWNAAGRSDAVARVAAVLSELRGVSIIR